MITINQFARLSSNLKYHNFFHFKSFYIEQSKPLSRLLQAVVLVKNYRRLRNKIPLINHIKTNAVSTLKTSKIYDGAAVLFHKRKDDDIQWLLRYNTHE